MSNNSDLLIIGAGAVGLCCAYYLVEAGCQVTVLEKGAVGAGCSSGNAGMIVPSHVIPLASPGMVAKGLKSLFHPASPFYIQPRPSLALLTWLWRFYRASTLRHVQRAMPLLRDLHLASLAEFERLAERLDNSFGFQKRGLLLLYRSAAGEAECRELAEAAHRVGLAAEMLSREEIARRDPNLETRADGVYFCGDAHLEPMAFLDALGAHLRGQGVRLLTDTEVLGLVARNGRVERVQTSSGTFAAREVVLAGGAWSPGLVRGLGVRLPLQPGKGYSVTFSPERSLFQMPLICTEARVAVTPFAERVRVAGTLELSGLDRSVNLRRVQAMLQAVPEYLACLPVPRVSPAEVWTGFRPCTPDGLPYVGRFERYRNLIAATGHAMLGLSLAPVTGKLVADIILGRRSEIDMGLLSPQRYGL